MKDQVMKLPLLSVLSILSICVSGQINKPVAPPSIKTFEILQKSKERMQPNDSLFKKMVEYLNDRTNLLSKRKGNIAFLPQDNMPCLVPDTKVMAPIPNEWADVKPIYKAGHHPIPNPVRPDLSFKYDVSESWKTQTK